MRPLTGQIRMEFCTFACNGMECGNLWLLMGWGLGVYVYTVGLLALEKQKGSWLRVHVGSEYYIANFGRMFPSLIIQSLPSWKPRHRTGSSIDIEMRLSGTPFDMPYIQILSCQQHRSPSHL
jgi:hypothetical protein